MRAPPPVSIDLPPERAWRGFQAAVHGLAIAALVAWAASHAGWAEGGPAPALLLGVAGATLAWVLGAKPTARLRWSGAEWLLQVCGAPEASIPAPTVMIDLGPWMLLRVQPPGGRTEWLAATRRHALAAWLPFRAAVYSNEPAATIRSDPERYFS